MLKMLKMLKKGNRLDGHLSHCLYIEYPVWVLGPEAPLRGGGIRTLCVCAAAVISSVLLLDEALFFFSFPWFFEL